MTAAWIEAVLQMVLSARRLRVSGRGPPIARKACAHGYRTWSGGTPRSTRPLPSPTALRSASRARAVRGTRVDVLLRSHREGRPPAGCGRRRPLRRWLAKRWRFGRLACRPEDARPALSVLDVLCVGSCLYVVVLYVGSCLSRGADRPLAPRQLGAAEIHVGACLSVLSVTTKHTSAEDVGAGVATQ